MSGRSRVDDEVITLSDNQPAQLQPVEAVKPFKLRISFCYQTKQITISARRFQRAFIKIIKSNGHFIESRAINPLRQWLVDAWPLINEAAQLRTSHFLHRHIFIDVSERAPLDCRRRFLISNRSRGQIALLVADNKFSQKASSFFFSQFIDAFNTQKWPHATLNTRARTCFPWVRMTSQVKRGFTPQM